MDTKSDALRAARAAAARRSRAASTNASSATAVNNRSSALRSSTFTAGSINSRPSSAGAAPSSTDQPQQQSSFWSGLKSSDNSQQGGMRSSTISTTHSATKDIERLQKLQQNMQHLSPIRSVQSTQQQQQQQVNTSNNNRMTTSSASLVASSSSSDRYTNNSSAIHAAREYTYLAKKSSEGSNGSNTAHTSHSSSRFTTTISSSRELGRVSDGVVDSTTKRGSSAGSAKYETHTSTIPSSSTLYSSRPSSSGSGSNSIDINNATTPAKNYNFSSSSSSRVTYSTPIMSTSLGKFDTNNDNYYPQQINDKNDNEEQKTSMITTSNNEDLNPKTPLTMMRSVMNSISRDRTEIEGARRPLYTERNNGGGGGGAGKYENGVGGEVVGQRENGESSVGNVGTAAAEGVPKSDTTAADMIYATTTSSNHNHDTTLDETFINEDETQQQQNLYHERDFGSATLPYGSQVILKFRNPTMSASVSIQPQSCGADGLAASPLTSRVCFVAQESGGGDREQGDGGGAKYGDNVFVVLKGSGGNSLTAAAAAAATRQEEDNDSTDNKEEEEEDPLADVLCYGDTVTLRSDVMRRVLGVQKEKIQTKNVNNGGGGGGGEEEEKTTSYRLDVGCFRRQGRYPQADQWTILRSGATAPIVQLGQTIIPSSSPTGEKRIPVYSGDPIVLRNDWSGGILSVGGEFEPEGVEDVIESTVAGWSLGIITSSYQMNDGTASTEDDKSLIEFLQEHNQCKPRRTETFQLVAANTPHSPDWVYSTAEGIDRVFFSGSYLSDQGRHTLPLEMEQDLFPESHPPSQQGGITHQQLVELPVDMQEQVLLDELVGAMMGLEGQFLRFHSMEIGETEEGEEYVEPAGFGFASLSYIGGNLDSSLQNILTRMLPLCSNYVHVNQYVSSCLGMYECGIVTRTLCEAINKLLQEYLAFVANLNYLLREETGTDEGKSISMSMVYVNSQPSIRTMAVLYQVVSTARGKKGGELLNALKNLMSLHYVGDAKGSEVMSFLLMECAAPYARMMQSWLQRGKIHDPYSEFMIEVTDKRFRESQVTFQQRMEWTDWCRVQEEHVLDSLYDANDEMSSTRNSMFGDESRATSNMSARDKAYTTGKYRRAIHFCNEGPIASHNQQTKTEQTKEEEVNTLLNPLQLSRCIDHSYHDASDTLLHLLMGKYDILSSLRFMKKYFLLDQGDFFVNFLDGVETELHKELPNVLQGRVQNWLSTTMARSLESSPQSSHSSQFASSLRCCFLDRNVRDTLHDMGKGRKSSRSKKSSRAKVLAGFEAIAFEFKNVPFPASLVLSPVQLRSYQLLFRQIFFAKYVERQLVNMWSDHQLLKQMTSLRAACSPTFSLRRRMLHFIQNFVYYMKFEVIEPHWRELENKLNASKDYCLNRSKHGNSTEANFPRTVDDLLNEHNQFLTRLFTQCLLSNYDLIERASKIMTTCLLFCTQIKFFMESTKVHETLETTRIERSMMRFGKKKKNTDQEAEFRVKREENIQRCSDRILQEYRTENYQHMIKKFDQVFTSHLAEFMKNLNSDYGQRSNSHLTNLFMQLDYNGFVSSSLH